MKYQLTKAATSSGANYSPRQISFREMRESNYLLKIFKALDIGDKETGKYLVNESGELKRF